MSVWEGTHRRSSSQVRSCCKGFALPPLPSPHLPRWHSGVLCHSAYREGVSCQHCYQDKGAFPMLLFCCVNSECLYPGLLSKLREQKKCRMQYRPC